MAVVKSLQMYYYYWKQLTAHYLRAYHSSSFVEQLDKKPDYLYLHSGYFIDPGSTMIISSAKSNYGTDCKFQNRLFEHR